MVSKFFAIGFAAVALAACAPESGDGNELVAIDVLLEPGQTMLDRASEWNQRMLELVPDGFELDELHRPHITLIQRHVRQHDVDSVLAAVDAVRREHDPGSLTLTARGLYHIPTGDLGLAGITVEPSERLLALQDAVIAAVNPYDAGAADEKAYVPDPTGAPFDPFIFEYVRTFVPEQIGSNFNPHVTIGLAPKTWLVEEEQKPFDEFDFGVDGIAVYQLGNFGTAAKRLDE